MACRHFVWNFFGRQSHRLYTTYSMLTTTPLLPLAASSSTTTSGLHQQHLMAAQSHGGDADLARVIEESEMEAAIQASMLQGGGGGTGDEGGVLDG